jgi:hypothetical protein
MAVHICAHRQRPLFGMSDRLISLTLCAAACSRARAGEHFSNAARIWWLSRSVICMLETPAEWPVELLAASPVPRQHRAVGWIVTRKMSHTVLTVPGMNEPPRRYDVTVRVAKDDGHQPGPAAFAVAASRAASCRNASVVSAHTADEIICVVCVAAPDRPSAVAVALAVVADALKTEDRVPSPSR